MRIKIHSDIEEDLGIICEILKISHESFVNTHIREMLRQLKKDSNINDAINKVKINKYQAIK